MSQVVRIHFVGILEIRIITFFLQLFIPRQLKSKL